jgi:hypothetical protein
MQTPNSVSQIVTGSRTVAGERRSRLNATKHGIFSKHLILDGEGPYFEKFHRVYVKSGNPKV